MSYLRSIIVEEHRKVATGCQRNLRSDINIDGVNLTCFVLISAGRTHSYGESTWCGSRVDFVVPKRKILVIADVVAPIVTDCLHLDESLSEGISLVRIHLDLVPFSSCKSRSKAYKVLTV